MIILDSRAPAGQFQKLAFVAALRELSIGPDRQEQPSLHGRWRLADKLLQPWSNNRTDSEINGIQKTLC